MPGQVAETVIAAISQSGIKGRPVNAEVATGEHGPASAPRPMRGGPRRDGGGYGGPRGGGGGCRGPRRDGGYGGGRYGDR